MTGTDTASETALVSSRSYPSFVPSLSILVRRISPAPSSSAFRAHLTASICFIFLPPWVESAHNPPSCLDGSPQKPLIFGDIRQTHLRDSSTNQSSPVASIKPPVTLLASIARTMHWLPNFSA